VRFIEKLFSCRHKRTTFPQSHRKNGRIEQPHVCCLKCGKEFMYDWKEMKVVEVIGRESGTFRRETSKHQF